VHASGLLSVLISAILESSFDSSSLGLSCCVVGVGAVADPCAAEVGIAGLSGGGFSVYPRPRMLNYQSLEEGS
jgi:hypothetical protein